jgi:hypothetical protein
MVRRSGVVERSQPHGTDAVVAERRHHHRAAVHLDLGSEQRPRQLRELHLRTVAPDAKKA